VSVVMNVPRLPEVPGLSFVPSLLRPRALPMKVMAPVVVNCWRFTYPGSCAAIGFHKQRIVATRRQTPARRYETGPPCLARLLAADS
jgi:hypothetical protein